MKKGIIAIIGCLFFISACKAQPKGNSAAPPSHQAWTSLLKKYVNSQGLVNYKGIIQHKSELQSYLDVLSANPPSDKWSKNDKIAYWINAYNAFTVKLIVDNYPVKSIKDIGLSVQIPFVNTPWQKEFFKIGGEDMKLDEIEHSILRKQFDESRIHFALVCASKSCPKLRTEAYEGSKLSAQLDDQAKDFLSNQSKNIITADKLKLSKYFTWFKGDFTKHSGLIDYLNKYAPLKINSNASISYLDYNWNLNEQ